MPLRVAFMSYAHENDEHDNGNLSRFRERLEGEVRVQLGNDFQIFQDRAHIQTGQQWEERLRNYLSKSEFFLPIVTPHYFTSQWCRKEFEYFWNKEHTTGRSPLIFPIYYIKCNQFSDARQYPTDSMAYRLARYHYADWRRLRHASWWTTPAKRGLERVASHIVDMFAHLDSGSSLNRVVDYTDSSAKFPHLLDTDNEENLGPPQDIWMLPRARPLVGRSGDLARVMEGLTRKRGSRIVRIEGPEGIGKTVLAAEAIRLLHMDNDFLDGIAVVLCSGIGDPLEILREILTRFDQQRRAPVPFDEGELIAEARRLLVGKDAAVVLDDVEMNSGVVRVIEALHSTGLALLVTSKNASALRHGVRIKLTALRHQDAMNLLTERMDRRPPDA